MTPPISKACSVCGAEKIIRRLPREVDRRLDYEKITLPGEPEQQHTIAILRITYERECLCAVCGHQWWETMVAETQKHV